MYNYITTIFTTNNVFQERILGFIQHNLLNSEHFTNINVINAENNIRIMSENPVRFTIGRTLHIDMPSSIRVGILAPDHNRAMSIAYKIHTNLYGKSSEKDEISVSLHQNLVQCIFKASSKCFPIFIFE